jgi:hypothetical protein
MSFYLEEEKGSRSRYPCFFECNVCYMLLRHVIFIGMVGTLDTPFKGITDIQDLSVQPRIMIEWLEFDSV